MPPFDQIVRTDFDAKQLDLLTTRDPPSWTRLEPQSVSGDPQPGLQARVHDPLWLLTRQWQLGEFVGEDAGSPLGVRVAAAHTPLARWQPGPWDAEEPAPWRPLQAPASLDELVTREPASTEPPSLRTRAEAALVLLAALRDAGLAEHGAAMLARCPLEVGTAPPHDGAWPTLVSMLAGRVPDAQRLALEFEAGPGLPAWLAPATAAARAQLETLVAEWLGWYRAEVAPRPEATPESWLGSRLEHRFSVSAPVAGGEVVLRAPAFVGGSVDWFSFDVVPGLHAAAIEGRRERHVLVATPLRFPGMPADRLWEFEDGRVNLGAVEAEPYDLAKLLLVEFAMTYGSDWLVVPLDIPFGSLAAIESLSYTNTFGERYVVERTDAARSDDPWRLFTVTGPANASFKGLLVPPAAVQMLEGPALEEVLFLRDEMANLAWGVERVVTGASGAPRARSNEPRRAPAGAPGTPVAGASLEYQLQTSVPAHWIPYVPRSNGYRSIELVRGAIRRFDGPTPEPIRPVGRLLNDAGLARLFDAEVPRDGVRVRRVPVVSRRPDGSYARWVARQAGVGRGEGSSGLAFDVATPRRTPPPIEAASVGAGPSPGPRPLLSPRFYRDATLASCFGGHLIRQGGGDPASTVGAIQTALAVLGFAVAPDGVFGSETTAAVVAYQKSRGLAPADGIVGSATAAALDRDFAHELIDAQAARLASGRFALGQRIGARVDAGEELAFAPFEAGLCVELGHAVAYAVPSAVADAWLAAGGASGGFGLPAGDPIGLDATRSAQEFEQLTLVFGPAPAFALSPAIWAASLAGRGLVGLPLGPVRPLEAGGGSYAPHDSGVVLAPDDASPQPLPQAVFDLWNAEATVGSPLGVPTAFGFPAPGAGGGIVFPFAAGTVILDEAGVAVRGGPQTMALERFFLPPDASTHLWARVKPALGEAKVGGASALAAMRDDIAAATHPTDFIYMLNWSCDVDSEMVLGDAGSTLRQLLPAAAAAGVQIRAMLWYPKVLDGGGVGVEEMNGIFAENRETNEAAATLINGLAGDAKAILDSRTAPFGSHHQKVLVVRRGDTLVAHVGGVEYSVDRLMQVPEEKGSPLYDTSVRLEGPASWQALDSFIARWDAHPDHSGTLRGASLPAPLAFTGHLGVQVTHTYAQGCPFAVPVRTIAAALANGIWNARQYVYMEDQYCVGSPGLGKALRDALNRNPSLGVLILLAPDEVVDDLPDLPFRRREFLKPLADAFPGRVLVFEKRAADGTATGAGTYVHSKLMIVDDEAAFIGSANVNRRGWSHDSEIAVTLVDMNGPGGVLPGTQGWVRALRSEIWARHLNLPAAGLGDPLTAAAAWLGAGLTSVAPYNLGATVPRFGNLPDWLLGALWNLAVDPE